MPLTRVTSNVIENGTIIDADISSAAGINPSKLGAGALPAGATVLATGSITQRSLSNRFADVVNVKDFGAVGNAVKLSNCSISSGSNVLNCSTANFTINDIGKSIAVGSADSTGHTIFTTIIGKNSATQITIGINASTTVSNSDVTYGTEDGPAIRNAIAYARTVNKAVYMPRGQYLMNTAQSTSSGNPQISSIPVGGGGYGIYLQNTSNVPQSFYMYGDGASIVSSLYPPQSGNDVGFTFVQIEGFFNEMHFEGIVFDSYKQMSQSQFGVGAFGRVYGFRFAGQNPYWSQENIPFNVTINNCIFYDQTLSIRADNLENLSVTNCSFLYRRGQRGVGDGDWTGAMGTRQVRSLRIIGNYMNGCLANDMNLIPSTIDENRCVDNFLHTGGGGGQNSQKTILVSNNIVTRFAREGIFVIASNINDIPSSFIDSITDGVQIVDNWFDGRYPANHVPTTNWAIRTADAHTTIVGNNIFQATVAILAGVSNPVVSLQASHHTLIANNNIILCPVSRPGYIGANAITIIADNVLVQGNLIVGHDIGSYRQNGWDGVGIRPQKTVTSSDIINNTITVSSNVFNNGSTIVFSNLPLGSGLTSQIYFVTNRSGDTFQISASENGIPVDILIDIAGATITASVMSITIGIAVLGLAQTSYGSIPPYIKCNIKNNSLKIISKNSPEVLSSAFAIDAGTGIFDISDNIIDGFDFALHRDGGGALNSLFNNNKVTRNIRLNSGYVASNYGSPLTNNHDFTIFPTQTGWYYLNRNGSRQAQSLKAKILVDGEIGYGRPVFASTAGTSNTSLFRKESSCQIIDFSVNCFTGSTNTGDQNGQGGSITIDCNSSFSSSNPAEKTISQIAADYSNNSFDVYFKIDKILEVVPLSFSGGGGSGALGFATVANGVITSATVTNAGTGYTSAPTVTVNANEIINRQIKFDLPATFLASISSNQVSSISVPSGGSGYAQPINIRFEGFVFYNALGTGVYEIIRISGNPSSNAVFVNVENGKKTITASSPTTSLSGGVQRFGNGPLQFGTVAPTTIVPEFIGQEYLDTVASKFYKANAITVGSWVALN